MNSTVLGPEIFCVSGLKVFSITKEYGEKPNVSMGSCISSLQITSLAH